MDKALRTQPYTASRVLVTGANGYVGAMVVASLLRDTAARVVCLVRARHERSAVLAPVIEHWQQQSGGRWSAAVEQRLDLMTLPDDPSELGMLEPALAGIDEIVHCAGCLDYVRVASLRAANLVYTAHLLTLARRLKVRRLVYVSTAFSGGWREGGIPEGPLDGRAADPTPYTLTKRQAEHLVAAGGVPFVILRPSILIGDSTTGRYSGRRYGLVQQWASLEELVCDRYHGDFHAVASDNGVHLLHQDAFCAAFKAAHRWLPDGSWMNLVSDPGCAPSLRDLWDLWCGLTRPARVHYYPRLADIPLRRIPARQRAYLTFAKVNLQIAAHPWQFETSWLGLLRERGLRLADATPASVRVCQDRYAAASPALAAYLARHAAAAPQRPVVIEAPYVRYRTDERAPRA